MQIPTLKDVNQYLQERDHFLILMHTKPDGDALGAAYALMKFLINIGKSASIGIEEDIFYKYRSFFPVEDRDRYFIQYSELHKEEFEHIIVVDTSSFSLLGLFKNLVLENFKHVLFLDHHIRTDSLEGSNYYIKQVSSTSEIILDLISVENLDLPMAKALYMGIVFDTGQFRHSGANSGVFLKVSKLLEVFNINKEDTYYYLFENETLERKKLEGALSSRIELLANGKIATAYLSLDLIKELFGQGVLLSENDMLDLTGVPHSLRGVQVSVMMRERKDQVTFSFRSRCAFSVAAFVGPLGGGGHEKAAGLKMPHMTSSEIREIVLLPLQEMFLQWVAQQD